MRLRRNLTGRQKHSPALSNNNNKRNESEMEPTSMIIAMGVIATLVFMRGRREGEPRRMSDEEMMDMKRRQWGKWGRENER